MTAGVPRAICVNFLIWQSVLRALSSLRSSKDVPSLFCKSCFRAAFALSYARRVSSLFPAGDGAAVFRHPPLRAVPSRNALPPKANAVIHALREKPREPSLLSLYVFSRTVAAAIGSPVGRRRRHEADQVIRWHGHKATISISVAEDGRSGPVRFLGVIPNTPKAVGKMAK